MRNRILLISSAILILIIGLCFGRAVRAQAPSPSITPQQVADANVRVLQDALNLAYDAQYANNTAAGLNDQNLAALQQQITALRNAPVHPTVSSGVYGMNPTANSVLYTTIGGYTALAPLETRRQTAWPAACTATSLYVTVSGSTLAAPTIVTLRQNGNHTALSVTIPMGAAPGVYFDSADKIALSAGDLLDYEVTQGNATGPNIMGISFACQ